jgi:prophage regulatory protein
MSKQLIRLPQVRERIPYSRSEIYRLVALGRFPKPIPIGDRAVAWDASEVEAWIAAKIEQRHKA